MSLAKDRKAVDFVKRSLDLVTCLSRRETTQGEVQMVVVEPPAVLCVSKVTLGSGGEEDRTLEIGAHHFDFSLLHDAVGQSWLHSKDFFLCCAVFKRMPRFYILLPASKVSRGCWIWPNT